ncbi:MAG TPA: cupin domain-containing protein [Chlamydiales bacterium]|nr:cupin domain-containing protein [Chlamydiales bacterium]
MHTDFEILGIHIRILANGVQTSKKYEMFEITAEKVGLGPGLHFHRQMQELFYIVSGQVVFTIDNKKIVAKSGDHLIVPKGVHHGWNTYGNDPIKMIITFSPAKNQIGYYQGLEALSRSGRSWHEAIIPLSEQFDNFPVDLPHAK